eukprot:scaffold29968_cov112-Isochrysis_galbana.AAC.6
MRSFAVKHSIPSHLFTTTAASAFDGLKCRQTKASPPRRTARWHRPFWRGLPSPSERSGASSAAPSCHTARSSSAARILAVPEPSKTQ